MLWKEAGCATERDYTEQTSWLLFLEYLDDLEQRRAINASFAGKAFDFIIATPFQWSSWAAPKDRDGNLDRDRALTGDDLLDFVNRELFPYLQGFRERASGPDTIEYKIGEIFGEVPFHDGGQWQARYYQHNAITRALEAIAAGRQRVLLTLATGTGKTAIAFQLAWKLFHSRWNLAAWRGDENTRRRPRILADQAYNSFSAFPEDALVRIVPDAIRKRGRVPKNGNLFFTDLAQHWWTPIYAIIRASKASGLNVRKASACIKVSKTALYAALKASQPDA